MHRLKRENGSLILTIVMVLGTVAGVSLFLMGLLSRQQMVSKQNKVVSASLIMRERMREVVAKHQVWQGVPGDSANTSLFSCMWPVGTGCCDAGAGGAGRACTPRSGLIRILDPDTGIGADPGQPLAGFTYDGNPCVNFGEGICVFRPEVEWTALCANPACRFPLDQLTIRIKFKSDLSNVVLNEDVHSVIVVRDSLHGDPASVMKRLLANIGTCPDGSGLTGVDSDGMAICAPY